MFDTDALNGTLAATFCDQPATWINASGSVTINIAFEITASSETEDSYQIGTEIITGECESSIIASMKRKDILVINSTNYSVQHVQNDGHGWAVITLEKS